MMHRGSVHEPEAELLNAEDAIQDAERLRAMFQKRRQAEQSVPLRVPLSALLEALDHLEPEALRQVAQRASERLAASLHAP
ncbi:hypothetical protein FJZ31_00255 [Candidatus Poribacteria bacterium]|nr:hypothetical protein [Candidatus Poribacteria bacterium]